MAAKKKNKKKTSTKKPATRKKAVAKTKSIGKKNKKKTRKAVRTQGKGKRGHKGKLFAGPSRPRRVPEEPELSGDLQGVSRTESADSESVDELLEEGNAFEAGIVEGVEDADAHAERGVHTREVPEDDVPEEYLDQD